MIDTVESNVISIVPAHNSIVPNALCFMFYEYQRALKADWIDLSETLFRKFEESPATTTGCVGNKSMHGKYTRTLKRLRMLLDTDEKQISNIRINSDEVIQDSAFLPCNMQIVWNVSTGGIRQGFIALRETSEIDLQRFVEIVSPYIFERVGTCYASAFNFPAVYGPENYMASVDSILKNESIYSNSEYSKRITMWRDETWHNQKRPSQGYLREIYLINYLSIEQLEKIGKKFDLLEYITTTGEIKPVENSVDMLRWDIPEERLEEVRNKLEPTGLILSAPHKLVTSDIH